MKSPLSKPQRAGIRLEYLRELSRFETALAKKVAKVIAAQGRYLAKWYGLGHEPVVQLLVDHRGPFELLLRTYYRKVMVTFYEKITRSLRKSVFEDALQSWLTRAAIDTVDQADATTVDIVKTAIANGISRGLSLTEIASYIEEVTDEDNALARATVIARTEMHDAMNFAQLTAAKDTGLTLVKIWTASSDARTREAHAEADGQTVPIDDDFNVDGEDVSRPGDGSASNAINCRCCMVFTRAPTDDSTDAPE